jgi:hypothetical protein
MNELARKIFADDPLSKALEEIAKKRIAEATLRYGGRAEDVDDYFLALVQAPCLPSELQYTYGPISKEVERETLAATFQIRRDYREKLKKILDTDGYLDAMLTDIIAEQKAMSD